MKTAELVTFSDETGFLAQAAVATEVRAAHVVPWRILIVDDDEDVHQATEFALSGVQILDRSLFFLHAHSSIEAIDLLMHETDIAVILLDVVMEKEDAGLAAVSVIRRDLGLINTQIILRTGQPGYAPELETIRRYEINDYRTKSELSRTKLYTALTSLIRSYDQLNRLETARNTLEQVVSATNAFLADARKDNFAGAILARAATVTGRDPCGLVIARTEDASSDYCVIASLGEFCPMQGVSLTDISAHDSELGEKLRHCLDVRRILIDSSGITLFFPGSQRADFAAYLPSVPDAAPVNRRMLEIFCSTVALCCENILLVDELSSYAFVDSLTGLASRLRLIAAIDERLAGTGRENLVVALLDVDQFAESNDMFGHAYGDQLLRGIAARLGDNLDPSCLLARVSGDTFAVLGNSEHVCPEILQPLFSAPFKFEGEECSVSIAMGFVPAVATSGTGADLLKDASIVIKRAKAAGFGRYAIYTPEMATETRGRSRILHDLSAAFINNQLFVVYQPQVSLADGRPVGVEALLRWRLPDGSFVPPDRFIPVAEHSGLIVPMGHWVLTTALAAQREITTAGFPGIRMAVNVSPPQFRQPDFLQRVDQAIEQAGALAKDLELEITESVAILGLEQVAATMAGLRERGISVAIDDFGTGYSSLSYLDRLPADRLKIDRAFVWALDSQKPGARIAEMVVPLGHQLSMTVIAEGVETPQQVELLKACGCDEAQGYLYSKPLPLDQLLAWLKQVHT